jgi:hypothetical protein
MALTRRSVLAVIAQFGGLALACSSNSTFAAATRPQADEVAAKLRSLVRNPWSARKIGQIYRGINPAENNLSDLPGLILSSIDVKFEDAVKLERRTLDGLLKARVRADFTIGQTAQLNGWILSRTEARLCALWT